MDRFGFLAADWLQQAVCNADARRHYKKQRHQVDGHKEEEEEALAETSDLLVHVRPVDCQVDVIEAVRADLARDSAQIAVDVEGVTLAKEVRTGYNHGYEPSGCQDLARA